MKNILIIGGSTGIGKATVEKLSNTNQVFATYFKNPVEDANATYIHLDVMSDAYDLDIVPEVLDGIVYCPGSINLKPMNRISTVDFLEDYQLQVLGAVKVIQQMLPRLKKSENASIVLFSTVAVQMGFNFHSLVAASKGAIEGLTKALAAEFAPKIRVNAIAPSITDTPLAGNLLNTDEKKEANAMRHPLKKIGKAEDIANIVEFLLSENSSWITGQIIHVDGGMSSIKS